jgi:hypothetical protein
MTVVAPQSLFLMNGQLVRDAARILAEKLWKQDRDEKEFVRATYMEILGRTPSAEEIRSARGYLTDFSREAAAKGVNEESKIAASASLCHALMCSSQFLYVD